MKTIVEKPTKTILFGAAVATAVLLIMLLAVNLTTGPARAQTPGPGGNIDGGNPDPYPNLSTYPNPQPCGPGAGTAFMNEPHEVRTGHYALFDAYWRTIATSTSGGPGLDRGPGVGVLHTNLCPPEMVKKNPRSRTVSRSARNGGMDIEEAIMHVLDKHLATTVATNAEATDGQLSLEEYLGVNGVVKPGDRVWWLRLDDTDTPADEKSDLGMGFSTLLLDKERWDSPMRYRFEVERHPADPTDAPHFFAYEAPKAGGAAQDPVWNSVNPGEGVMELDPGEYKALQWVFTKPGTYLLWVHLLGDVKKPGAGENWKAISSNDTETSEVYRYTIQVGTPLDEIEPPIFGVNLEVDENSPGYTSVGDPIPVYNADADVLYYDLTGPGHSDFRLVTSTNPHTVQIEVAYGAILDYETKPSYDLNLSVTDRVDHEDNKNPSTDDVLIVRIDLVDQEPGVVFEADRKDLKVGEEVTFSMRYEPAPEHMDGWEVGYLLSEYDGTGTHGQDLWRVLRELDDPRLPNWSTSIVQHSAVTKTYRMAVELVSDDDNVYLPTFIEPDSNIEVTWKN